MRAFVGLVVLVLFTGAVLWVLHALKIVKIEF
jgi:hypothetical protein